MGRWSNPVNHRQLKRLCLHAGVAQLGEQQTEGLLSILEVPCSIHGPGNVFIFLGFTAYYRSYKSTV